jgi:hypothetical protein
VESYDTEKVKETKRGKMKRAKTTKGAATAAHTVDPNGVDAKASTTATAASLLRLGADLSNEEEAQTRKRKQADGSGMENTGASAAPEDGYVVDGVLYPYPQDFWFWLPEGQTAGQLDVLCGRGGESNHSVGNKRFRQIIKDRKVSVTLYFHADYWCCLLRRLFAPLCCEEALEFTANVLSYGHYISSILSL